MFGVPLLLLISLRGCFVVWVLLPVIILVGFIVCTRLDCFTFGLLGLCVLLFVFCGI